jgi:formylmethanofuran dehydrogenase subunit C
MTLITDLVALVLSAFAAIVAPSVGDMERRVERSFEVAAGSLVSVDISGGSISVSAVPGRTAKLVLIQRVDARSEREADAALEQYEVTLGQAGSHVRLATRRKTGYWPRRDDRVRMNAELMIPADVKLDLDTSGGSITIVGERAADVAANTAGGSIRVDGGTGTLDVGTSGGSIHVGRALRSLHADTSGGSITVAFVGSEARDVTLDTSGGSIRVGVSPAARMSVEASTSGGSVSAHGLPITMTRRERHALTGMLNGGGGRLRAATSGGSVSIQAAE